MIYYVKLIVIERKYIMDNKLAMALGRAAQKGNKGAQEIIIKETGQQPTQNGLKPN